MTLNQYLNTFFSTYKKIELRLINEKGAAHFARRVFTDSPADFLSALKAYEKIIEEKNLFACVGVNPRDGRGRVAAQSLIVIDVDNAALSVWAHKYADAIFSRDEYHHHIYFRFLERPENAKNKKQYSETVKKLLTLAGSSEKAAHDTARVIRLPFLPHRKNGVENARYALAHINKLELVEFEKRFEFLVVLESAKPAAPATTTQAQTINNTVEYIYNNYARKPLVCAGGGRSRELFFIGLDCHAWGVKKEDAEKLAERISKERHTPPEKIEIIKHQIDSAYKYARGEFGANLTRGTTDAAQQREKRLYELTLRARDVFERWVYVHEAERFVNLDTRQTLTSESQRNNFIAAQLGEAVSFSTLLARGGVMTCDKIDYMPSDDRRVITRGSLRVLNSYTAPENELRRENKKAVKIFCEHVDYIADGEKEAEILTDYFAHLVQKRGDKIDWAPLIISPKEGIGKSAFVTLFEKIFGAHNCATVSARKLLSGFNDFVGEKLFVAAHEVETREDAALDELKSLITEKRIKINAKYAREYDTENHANFLFLSNKVNALRLDKNSRRFFVIFNRRDPKPLEYYDALFDAFENGAGFIYDFLMARNLDNFRPHGAAPKTNSLELVAASTQSDAAVWIEDALENKKGAFASEIVSTPDILTDATMTAPSSASKFITARFVSTFLAQRGWSPRMFSIKNVTKRGWFCGSDSEFQAAVKKLRESEKEEKVKNT